ncbi:MAG: hypothetical protein K2X32_01270 [Phycisphaerales bacterium]|nr:hypothetical protein [Phycisphaerales bacterium]
MYYVSAGRKWYDFVSASNVQSTMFSERAIEAFASVGAQGYRVVPVKVSFRPNPPPKLAPPKYFAIELTSCVRLDVAASGYEQGDYCTLCARRTATTQETNFVRKGRSLDMSTYDGADIFAVGHLESRNEYCSLKIVEVARKYKLTNSAFQPWAWQEDPERYMEIIDYLGGPWPPIA